MPYLTDGLGLLGQPDQPFTYDIYGRQVPMGGPRQPAPMMMPAASDGQPQRPPDVGPTLAAGKLVAETGLSLLPGSGFADALGLSPNLGGEQAYPSLMENVARGEWGTAAGQTLGLLGDAAYAATPFTLGIAAPIGAGLKLAGKTVKEVAAAEKAAAKAAKAAEAAKAAAAPAAPPPINPQVDLGFNYGQPVAAPLPLSWKSWNREADKLRKSATIDESAKSWSQEMALRDVRIATTPEQRVAAEAKARQAFAPPSVTSLLAPTRGTSPMRGERIIGAPSKVKTPQQEDRILQNYLELAKEGATGRDWYSDAGKYILKMTGGDPIEASRLAAFLAVTSAGTPVEANLEFAARAWNQWKTGAPLATGRYPKEMTRTINRVLEAEDPAAIFATLGRKRGTFAQALAYKGGWISDAPKGYVNDVWNGRALGYPDISLKARQHDWMDRQQDRALAIANELGLGGHSDWDRQRLQAAVWAAIKSRSEKTSVPAAAREYSSFGDPIEGRVLMEAGGGPATPSTFGDRYNTAPWRVRKGFTEDIQGAVTDASGRNRLATAAGVLTSRTEPGIGAYLNTEGKVVTNPNFSFDVLTGKAKAPGNKGPAVIEPASQEVVDFLAAGHTLMLGEEGVGVIVPGSKTSATKTGTSQTGLVDIDLGRPVGPRDMAQAARLMREVYGPDAFNRMGVTAAPGGNGFHIFSYDPLKGKAGTAFAEGGQRIGETLGAAGVTNRKRPYSTNVSNNWNDAPADWEVIQKITANPQLRAAFEKEAGPIIDDLIRAEKSAGKAFGPKARTGLLRVRQAIIRVGLDGLMKLPRNALSVGALTVLAGVLAQRLPGGGQGTVAGEEPATVY